MTRSGQSDHTVLGAASVAFAVFVFAALCGPPVPTMLGAMGVVLLSVAICRLRPSVSFGFLALVAAVFVAAWVWRSLPPASAEPAPESEGCGMLGLFVVWVVVGTLIGTSRLGAWLGHRCSIRHPWATLIGARGGVAVGVTLITGLVVSAPAEAAVHAPAALGGFVLASVFVWRAVLVWHSRVKLARARAGRASNGTIVFDDGAHPPSGRANRVVADGPVVALPTRPVVRPASYRECGGRAEWSAWEGTRAEARARTFAAELAAWLLALTILGVAATPLLVTSIAP